MMDDGWCWMMADGWLRLRMMFDVRWIMFDWQWLVDDVWCWWCMSDDVWWVIGDGGDGWWQWWIMNAVWLNIYDCADVICTMRWGWCAMYEWLCMMYGEWLLNEFKREVLYDVVMMGAQWRTMYDVRWWWWIKDGGLWMTVIVTMDDESWKMSVVWSNIVVRNAGWLMMYAGCLMTYMMVMMDCAWSIMNDGWCTTDDGWLLVDDGLW